MGVWIVERTAFGATHWSDPPASFGPFLPEGNDNDDGRKAAERFASSKYGGMVINVARGERKLVD